MSRENQRSNIKKVTAAAAALLLAAAFIFPSEIGLSELGFGNAVTVSAETTEDGFQYYVSGDGEVAIAEYNGLGGDVTVPATIDGKAVTSIETAAFIKCTSLTSVTLPDSITSIGSSAFAECTNLKSINIPNNVTYIGDRAFQLCESLKSVVIPPSVTSVGDGAFVGCPALDTIFYYYNKLDNISDIADSTTSKVSYVFYDNGVSEIAIKSVIKKVELGENQSVISLPDKLCDYTLTAIGNSAFMDCTGLKSVSIPNSVTEIGLEAFKGCTSLESIAIPTGVTLIMDETFAGCSSLASVSFHDNVTQISKRAFADCTSLKSVTLPSGLGSYADNAFAGCENLESIELSNTGDGLYSADGILYERSTSFGSLSLCTYPPKKAGASFEVPNNVTYIAPYAFSDCQYLNNIIFTNKDIYVDSYAFNGNTSITSAFFSEDSYNVPVYLPDSVTQAKYTVDADGNVTITEVTLGSGQTSVAIPDTIDGKPVTSIGENAFNSCANLESVTFGENSKLNSIGHAAFNLCTSLKSIEIPDSVTSIKEQAFAGCKLLESVTFGDDSKLNSIDQFAFLRCEKLKSMIIPAGVTSLGESVFLECQSLDSVFYPSGLNNNLASYGSVSRICYSVSDNKAVISEVVLGGDKTDVAFPSTISGLTVYLGDNSLVECPEVSHTHREKTAATCTNKSVCAICGQEYGEIDPDNHSFTNYVSNNDATCTENETETATCERCDETDTREIADSTLGHDNSGDWLNDTTNHWKVCTRNDCEEILDKANHDYDDGKITTKPTEETEGVTTYTCKTCGYEKTEPIAKLNHTHKTSEEYSKDETGHWHDCSGCDEKIDFESHDFDEGVVTTEPTDKIEGVKTFTCKDCGYEKTETIPVTKPSIPETPAEKVNSFVERLYENVLGRHSDPSKETHIDNLNNGETATKVAYDFVFSPEFTELDISNAERVTIMYNTFLNRDPDPAGLETWTKALDNGCSIGHIFYGFTQSGEFGDICKEYGIEQGTWEYVENRDKSAELTSFVSRLYTHVLNRKFDVNGLNDHTGNYLENHDLYQMAYNFIFSPEFIEKELSDEEFVDTMYRTFFDREADPDGKADWLDRMANQGYTREDVLAGFVGSQECADLVAKFGI